MKKKNKQTQQTNTKLKLRNQDTIMQNEQQQQVDR